MRGRERENNKENRGGRKREGNEWKRVVSEGWEIKSRG